MEFEEPVAEKSKGEAYFPWRREARGEQIAVFTQIAIFRSPQTVLLKEQTMSALRAKLD